MGLHMTAQVWIPDNGDGTYKNPIIHADYSDPDVCKVGDDFYMTSSSFNAIPGLPILHSSDLVNWTLINHALPPNVDAHFDIPQHGNGVWAPSIRYHEGMFYIYWGDPDRGIFMVKTDDPAGTWSAPVLVKKAYGNIDACPLWDENGRVYLVHAFAHSRAGVNSTLQVMELSKEGDEILDKGRIVVDGHEEFPTLEGPKFYKRNGYYYIFAPAGGVPTGWQTVFRSKNIYGPYESKIVLEQGDTPVNGPHQGGLIELENGESWFLHFQDKEEYGRVVHLQPVIWKNDWPVMGVDKDEDGAGNPVLMNTKPTIKSSGKVSVPQTSDEFEEDRLDLQWQWNANPKPHWYQLNQGKLRLHAIPSGETNLWMVPNIVTQKLPAPKVEVLAKVDVAGLRQGEEAGLLVFGLDYAGLQLTREKEGIQIQMIRCLRADKGTFEEPVGKSITMSPGELWLKATIEDGLASYAFSPDGKLFQSLGGPFDIKEGKWVGAKIALYCRRLKETGLSGFLDVDFVRLSPLSK